MDCSSSRPLAQHRVTAENAALRSLLGVILPARLLINAQFRIVYPFLPAISRGLGLPLKSTALLVAIRAAVGATSPLYGYLSDRLGRKALMILGLCALVIGAAMVALARSFGIALIAFGLLGLAKSSYDPAMQAYISDAVPYEQRGRALAISEFSWAGSWLLGVPIAGFLMARWGWHAPFAGIALVGLICIAGTWTLRESVRSASQCPAPALSVDNPRSTRFNRALFSEVLAPSAGVTLLASALVILANENLFLVYGAWMETRYALSLTNLGTASVVISLAELVAAVTAAGVVDRLGKRRSLLGGLLLNALAYFFLPLTSSRLSTALVGLVLVALTAEFSIVSAVPLISGISINARGTVMALNAALMCVAVIIASLVAPRLWEAGGLWLIAGASGASALGAALLLWHGVKDSSLTSQ